MVSSINRHKLNKPIKFLIIFVAILVGIILVALAVLISLNPTFIVDIGGGSNVKNNLNKSNINTAVQVNNFEDCQKAGFPISEIYPPQCQANGQTYTKDIGNQLDKIDLIQVVSPRPGQKIESPLVVVGEARGGWYMSGQFPVKLMDNSDRLIASGQALAQTSWTTEDFVRFEAEIKFEVPKAEVGYLLLEKSNPSGLPKNADFLKIPVNFK
jgi:hypothetical protein